MDKKNEELRYQTVLGLIRERDQLQAEIERLDRAAVRHPAGAAAMTEQWTHEKPTQPGAYWVRGNGLDENALVEVKAHEGALWCNLHMVNTEPDIKWGYTIAQIHSAFEWLGPLYAAPVVSGKAWASWVSVEDRLPDSDRGIDVLVYRPGAHEMPANDHMRAIQQVFRGDVAALNGGAVAGSGWIACADRMPESGRTVLAYYLNSFGNDRRIRAQHVKAWTILAEDYDTECVEYSEQEDADYLLEGWYECIDNWDEYYRVQVNEGPITHWMPLPPSPAAKAGEA